MDTRQWKNEGKLPGVPMIIKDGSSGKYHNIYKKGSSCQQTQGSGMLGMPVRNLTAERECQNGRSVQLAKE